MQREREKKKEQGCDHQLQGTRSPADQITVAKGSRLVSAKARPTKPFLPTYITPRGNGRRGGGGHTFHKATLILSISDDIEAVLMAIILILAMGATILGIETDGLIAAAGVEIVAAVLARGVTRLDALALVAVVDAQVEFLREDGQGHFAPVGDHGELELEVPGRVAVEGVVAVGTVALGASACLYITPISESFG